MRFFILALAAVALMIASTSVFGRPGSGSTAATEVFPTQNVNFDMSNLQVASLEDPTKSTGATLFYFPNGAAVQADVRGGSAATSELNLFDEAGYSNVIDGVVLTGGSTMGLAAGDGVREALFKKRTQSSNPTFDTIPSVPTAVVYDFGKGRQGPNRDLKVYPDRKLGMELMNHLMPNTFIAGRAGAGISTTANKVSKRIWGGQGAAVRDVGFAKVFAAVVVNAMGDINVQGITPAPFKTKAEIKAGTNTTISIVVTDAKLSKPELKRLAMMVHTSMARMIFPFHSFYDGDTHFAVSAGSRTLPNIPDRDSFLDLSVAAADAMKDAIELSVRIANSAN